MLFHKTQDLDTVLQQVIGIFNYIAARNEAFKRKVPAKRPQYVKTRWDSACNVLEFLIANKDDVESFLIEASDSEQRVYESKLDKNRIRASQGKEIKQISEPDLPEITSIPITWFKAFDVLDVIRKFTSHVEKDLAMQQDVYLQAMDVENKLTALEVMGNEFAKPLREAFEYKFMNTADLLLSELAYRFTPIGFCDYKRTIYASMSSANRNEAENAVQHHTALQNRFTDLCEHVFGITNDEERAENGFPLLFDWFFENVECNAGETTISLWRRVRYMRVIISSKRYSMLKFWQIGISLVTMPASEAICERCFSQVRRLTNDWNKNTSVDLFEALATIRLATHFLEQYP